VSKISPSFFKKTASIVLPVPLKRVIKYLFRTPQRIGVYKKKAQGTIVTKQGILTGLHALGIKKGDTVFVHSSLSMFGYVDGGAKTIIEALLEAVGSNGNLCMPSFGQLADGKTFDVRNTPSALGKVPELFWRLPQAKRSLSPTHSVACLGKDAIKITKDHLKDPTPFGKNSPYYKMMNMGGKVIALGSPLRRSLTCNYILEDELGDKFPIKVYLPGTKEFIIIDVQGKKQVVKKRVHDTSIDPIRIDYQPELCDWFEGELIKRNCLKKGKIGEATVRIYGITCLIETLRELLKQGKTIYAESKE
jgi:aminoglycoside 3-N-acetyltransferase